MKTQILYRPIGLTELKLIAESGFEKFPPRLEWQPIFYPVLNEEYASQIANDWNSEDDFSGNCGFVTQFNVKTEYLKNFQVQNVGGFIHEELWVPAKELDTFNANIIGLIKVIKGFFGEKFILPKEKVLIETIKKLRNDA